MLPEVKAHPWLRPLWRRVLVLAVCLGWLAMEAYGDPNGLWFWMALAVTAWGVWEMFLSGAYRGGEGKT